MKRDIEEIQKGKTARERAVVRPEGDCRAGGRGATANERTSRVRPAASPAPASLSFPRRGVYR